MFKVGDKVRCINPYVADVIAFGEVVEVLKVAGAVLIVTARKYPKGISWRAHRFELVAPEVVKPAIIGPFKAGDRVVCIDAPVGSRLLQLNQTYTVECGNSLNPKLYICINGTAWSVDRFKLAAPAVPVAPEPFVPVVGMKVICVNGIGRLHAKREYTIRKVNRQLVQVEDLPGLYQIARFIAAEQPAKAPEPVRPFAVGDKVFITGRFTQTAKLNWNEPAMGPMVGNGQEYQIIRIEEQLGRIHLSNQYYFTKECLTHADAAPAAKAVAPVVEPAKLDAVETIRKELVKRELEKGYGNITSFATKRVGGGGPEYSINPACFAGVNRSQTPIEIFVLEVCKHKERDEAACTPYLNYLFNDSPWAPCFITKDVKEAYEKGVVMNCNLPIGQLVGAGCAVREGIERPQQLDIFNKMLKAGYHGNVAYLMCLTVQGTGPYTHQAARGGHCAMTTNAESADVLSFFKNGFPNIGVKAANAPGRTVYTIFNQISQVKNPKKYYTDFAKEKLPTTLVGTGFAKNHILLERTLFEYASFLEPLITPEKK